MSITVSSIDHLVLTVEDIDRTCKFYQDILGMEVVSFGSNRKALVFGDQKINLHEQGKEISPHSARPTPGSADLCLISNNPIEQIIELLRENAVDIIDGPVEREGARGVIRSVYFHDPDNNLLEISNY